MTCIPIPNGFICTETINGAWFKFGECEWELERRKHYIQDLGYYGARITCCHCGFQFETDGPAMPMGVEEAEKRAAWARKAPRKKLRMIP